MGCIHRDIVCCCVWVHSPEVAVAEVSKGLWLAKPILRLLHISEHTSSKHPIKSISTEFTHHAWDIKCPEVMLICCSTTTYMAVNHRGWSGSKKNKIMQRLSKPRVLLNCVTFPDLSGTSQKAIKIQTKLP